MLKAKPKKPKANSTTSALASPTELLVPFKVQSQALLVTARHS
jgi:hypothetical protein